MTDFRLAPAGCRSRAMTWAALVLVRPTLRRGCLGAACLSLLGPDATAGAGLWRAFQIRVTPVWRSVNFLTGCASGSVFQILTSRPPGQPLARAANCSAERKRSTPRCGSASSVESEHRDVVVGIEGKRFHR